MTEAYQISRPIDEQYYIAGKRAFWLPLLDCPRCSPSTYSLANAYPTIPVKELSGLHLPPRQTVLSPDEFQRETAEIRKILGPDRPAIPGMGLGPLQSAYVHGDPAPLMWSSLWFLLIDHRLLKEAEIAGIKLCVAKTLVTLESTRRKSWFEIEALQTAKVHSVMAPPRCDICGRRPFKNYKTITLDAKSYDDSVALQRTDALAVLIASPTFGRFLIERDVPGMELKRVKVL